MSSRSLNKVQLIGNMTRDPELRYTPAGTAVCTFGLATNRTWTTENGEKKEEVEFHRLVAWNKLAELCAQLLFKGRRIYVEGRLQTRSWTAQDGTSHQMTEVVVNDMMILDSKRANEEEVGEIATVKEPEVVAEEVNLLPQEEEEAKASKKTSTKKGEEKDAKTETELGAEDIPF
ncbi:MAG: single-stranded DNA-binding protein [bacterium]|nr:single-stranded DNA-binding protein [bacterium]